MACWCKGKCPHVGRASALLKQKAMPRARVALRTSLSLAPMCVESNLLLANLLSQHNHAHAAMVHVNRAAQYGEPGRIHFERAKVLRAQIDLPNAREEFYKAMQADPNNPMAAAGLIGSLEMAGLLKEAAEVCAAARLKFPDNTDIRRLEAVILDAQGDTAGALVLSQDGLSPPLAPIELLDRGRYQEKKGLYGAAWDSWMTGKAILRDKIAHVYDSAYWDRYFAALTEASAGARLNFMRRAQPLSTNPGPLFVCGYPRSGTTLAETILSSHPRILAGDELMGLTDVIEALPSWLRVRLPYPAALIATSLGENFAMPELLRDLYMAGARERMGFKNWPNTTAAGGKFKAGGKPLYFTDKMPLNEIHLPLLRMLFPAAPIFRMQRHPLDVMVSCMSNWLVHGGFYASSLESCAAHYKAVDDLVQHHEKQFAIADRRGFQTVRYETLVAEPAATIEGLLKTVQLPADKACMTFHKNKRTARTLSYRQVQQPMNSIGIGRWKNFRAQLAPAVEILRPILEREGYEF